MNKLVNKNNRNNENSNMIDVYSALLSRIKKWIIDK